MRELRSWKPRNTRAVGTGRISTPNRSAEHCSVSQVIAPACGAMLRAPMVLLVARVAVPRCTHRDASARRPYQLVIIT